MIKRYTILVILALLTSAAVSAQDFDQPAHRNPNPPMHFQPPDMGDGPGGPGGQMDERHLRRMERFQLMKLVEFLNLDDDTEDILVKSFRKHKREQAQLIRTKEELTNELSEAVKNNDASDKYIISTLDSLKHIDISIQQGMTDFFDSLDDILTPVQQAKLYIFHARFAQQVLGKMREFQKNRPGRDKFDRRENYKPDNNSDGR